jgi:hypothetical protein
MTLQRVGGPDLDLAFLPFFDDRKYESGAVGTLTHVVALQGASYACELEVYADGFLLKCVYHLPSSSSVPSITCTCHMHTRGIRLIDVSFQLSTCANFIAEYLTSLALQCT